MVQPLVNADAAPESPRPRRVRIADVARLADAEHVSLSVAESLRRKGPFPLYAENCAVRGIDDYAIEAGGTVMVAAYGQVLGADGRVMARYEPGRCSATEHVHALVPHDRADARYLWRVVGASPRVAHMVAGTQQLRQLNAASLMSAPVPWPDRSVRDAVVAELDEADRRIAELDALVPALLDEGDAAYRRLLLGAGEAREVVPAGEAAMWCAGTDVPAARRGPHKPVRVEGPRGSLGRCDEALASGPAVCVGAAGRRLLAHYVAVPSHPIAEVRYAVETPGGLSLPALLFALRAAGLLDRLTRDGAPVEAPALPLSGLDALELRVGTPEARAAFEPLARDLLGRLVAAEDERASVAAARTALLDDLTLRGTFHGEPVADVEPPQPAAPVDLSGSARPVSPLGPLAGLAENPPAPLAGADLAWELAPLAAVRALADQNAWSNAARAARGDTAGLVGALDDAMEALAADDLLAFLPNLSYQSSLLAPAQLAVWVRALDGIDPAAIEGSHVRAAFALDEQAPALPGQVEALFAAVVRAAAGQLGAGWETAYVPYAAFEGVCDLLGRAWPNVTLRAQFADFAPILASALVRAVDLRGCDPGLRGGLGAAPGSALVHDEFPDWAAPLVVSALPPSAGVWSEKAPDASDPRWRPLGVPPRNKSGYAWVQHALAHQAPGGVTVLLAENSLLHTASGSEPGLRRALAASGRVRAVVSLPARVLAGDTAASSILVLGDARPEPDEARCLMVDLLGCAVASSVGAQGPQRELPAEAADRAAQAVRTWFAGGSDARAQLDEPGFSRAVSRRELVEKDGLLTPWSYV
jgi:hypothetical protein